MMSYTEFKDLEKEYFKEKEVQEKIKEISLLYCPVCGHSLKGRIGEAKGDTLDFKAYIDCQKCNMFHAESECHYSYYGNGNVEVLALEDVMKVVAPYIKVAGVPVKK